MFNFEKPTNLIFFNFLVFKSNSQRKKEKKASVIPDWITRLKADQIALEGVCYNAQVQELKSRLILQFHSYLPLICFLYVKKQPINFLIMFSKLY